MKRFWKRRPHDEEIDEEIRTHLQMAMRDRMERGETADQAKHAARREFGNVGLVKDVTRDAWGPPPLSGLGQDVRWAVRMLRKQPGFSLVVILALAVGIGANTAIFSLVNGILLRPLPLRAPERLVFIEETIPRNTDPTGISFPNYLDWKAQSRMFDGMGLWQAGGLTIAVGDTAMRHEAASVSYDLFETLGVAPLIGRTFTAEEDRPGNDNVLILGYDLWRNAFGGDAGIVGRTVSVNRSPVTVVGIMPQGFRFPTVAEAWVPLGLDTTIWTRTDHGLGGVARLKPGVSIETAQAEMDGIARGIAKAHPVTNTGLGVKLTALHERLNRNFRDILWVLLGAVGFVLLIACANVAHLLLARAGTRRREMAIRQSLGASRPRLIRQLLVESMVLAFTAAGFGVILAVQALRLLSATIPVPLPYWMTFDLDPRVLAFTFAVSVLTGILFGSAPALQAWRTAALRTSSVPQRRRGFRSALVVAELALSLILVAGAGLLMRSFLSLQQVESGIDPSRVLTFNLAVPVDAYPAASRRVFFHELLNRLRALPEVEEAGAIINLPFSGNAWGRSLTVEGHPVLSVSEAPIVHHEVTTPGYLRAMGIRLLAGRDFDARDTASSTRVLFVNQSLVARYWPDGNAIGRRVRLGPPEDEEPWHTVVGVVGDVRFDGLDQEPRMEVYLPYAQIPVSRMSVIVRSRTTPGALVASVRRIVSGMDSALPVTNVATMEDVVRRSFWQRQLYTRLFGIFAALAVGLAALGVYGVLAYMVTQQTSEIGVRMAIGARNGDILRLILSQGLGPSVVGILAGLLGAIALSRYLKSFLFQVSPNDPGTLAGVAVALSLVALAACCIPARRAMRVDPSVALRHE